jgi:hypothetical protein
MKLGVRRRLGICAAGALLCGCSLTPQSTCQSTSVIADDVSATGTIANPMGAMVALDAGAFVYAMVTSPGGYTFAVNPQPALEGANGIQLTLDPIGPPGTRPVSALQLCARSCPADCEFLYGSATTCVCLDGGMPSMPSPPCTPVVGSLTVVDNLTMPVAIAPSGNSGETDVASEYETDFVLSVPMQPGIPFSGLFKAHYESETVARTITDPFGCSD